MGIVNRPTETFGPSPDLQPPNLPAPSLQPEEAPQFAPRWARKGRARTVVSLRAPEEPRFGDPLVDATRARSLDALEGEPTLRRVLQSPSLDPAIVSEPPRRDSVGLALGMIARLMVAGCATAGIALLLIGAFPSPFKPAAPETSVVAKTWSSDAASAVRPGARIGDEPRAVEPAAPTLRAVRTLAVPEVAAPEPRMLDHQEIARLIQRGEDFLGQGDVAAARLFLTRAAEARDARAALALGTSFDPAVLKQLGALGARADVALARAWYEKAALYGSAEASRRLAALPRL